MKKKIVLLLVFFQTIIFASEWERVYLASFPRSGNHWVRYLIEEATGIATGSAYLDKGGIFHDDPIADHVLHYFPWGGYCMDHGYCGNCRYPNEDEPIVIKTHNPTFVPHGDVDLLPFQRAVCLIRHPVDTFYSYHLYDYWLKDDGTRRKVPDETFKTILVTWKRFYEFWEKQEKVVFIRYEDLFREPEKNLALILQTIGYPFSEEDLSRAVKKYPPRGGINRYTHCFSQDQKAHIAQEFEELLDRYGYEM